MYYNFPVLFAMMAASQIDEDEQYQKNQKEQENITLRLLLMKGDADFMELGKNETIIFVKVILDSCNKWSATVGEEEIIENSLTECVHMVIQKSNAKGVQLIPFSVSRNCRCVNSYMMMLKVMEVEKANIETSLKSVADKMSEELKTAW